MKDRVKRITTNDRVKRITIDGQTVWMAIVAGKPVRAFFNSKGAAVAGIEVEKRRIIRVESILDQRRKLIAEGKL